MKSTTLIAALGLCSVAGCPDPNPANPSILWLAPDGVETEVKLSPIEPRPY